MLADPEVMRHLGGAVERESAWRQMALFAGHWLLRGHGQWVLERRADGLVLGRAGTWAPEGWPGLEVGWALAREAWGAGYATEAARAVVAWVWERLESHAVIALIAPGNERSERVARRLGMHPGERRELPGGPVVTWRLERPA
jgi:RimJ/RimL family protein N-acetyltransferase